MADYDQAFYNSQQQGSVLSARAVVPLVLEFVKPRRVIDVGCGVGGWLSVFLEHGAREVVGLDGSWVDPARLLIPRTCFHATDLTQPLPVQSGFDLAVSMEVAEHLPPDAADGFAASLAALAPVLLFSAAVPQQGGTRHLNEQWPAYWASRFRQHGFLACDCLRARLWDRPDVEWWYAQNALLFVRESELGNHPALAAVATSSGPPAWVHPRAYLAMAEERRRYERLEHASVKRLLARVPTALREGLARRWRRRSGGADGSARTP